MHTPYSAYILDAVRTPVARYRGALANVRPDDLFAHLLVALRDRDPDALGRLDHVIAGATNQAGEDNRNVARMASLIAGLPYEVPAVTVNRLCGSGLEAVTDAAMRIWVGDADVAIAGGVESMTRAPFAFRKAEEAFGRAFPTVYDTTLGWRFENPKMAERFKLESMGETAENVADKWKVTRRDQDLFALGSQHRAAKAIAEQSFQAELVGVPVPKKNAPPAIFSVDESPRPDATLESLGALPPAFRKGGSVTAGNSSPLSDGASAVLVVSEAALGELKAEPLARIVGFASVGVEPNLMGEGPINATKKALKRAGWRMSDVDIVEVNEAFAAQAIACMRALEIDPERVNVNGGAIALGHAIGSSGSRILTTLVHTMKRRNLRRGVATLCIGVGQGITMLVER